MRTLFLFASLLLTTPLTAQLYSFQFDWKRLVHPFGTALSDNTESRNIVEIPGEGYVWAGEKIDQFFATDIWIQKIDYSGNVVWDTTFGGDFYDSPQQLRVLNDGSFIIAGLSGSTNISNNWHWDDVILIKYSASGHLDWWKRYGSVDQNDHDFVTDLRVCNDGGFVVSGAINVKRPNGTKSFNAWIFKTDSDGNIQWNRNYGGYWEDIAQSLIQTSDQGYMVAVSSQSSDGDFDINTHETDPWLIKLDANGAIQWKKHFGGTESEYWYFIEPAPDGGFILSGEIEPGSDLVANSIGSAWDAWVCRVSATGDLIWSKNFGGSKWDAVREMTPGPSGVYWHSGFTLSNDQDICRNRGFSDFWVFAVDLEGNLTWSQTFGGSGYDDGLGICVIPNGFVACGNATSKDGDVGPLEPYQSGWLLSVINTETFHIKFPTNDTTFCGEGSLKSHFLLPDSINAQWNTGFEGNTYEITESGLYTAEADLYGCRSADTLHITIIPKPELRGDTTICFKDSILLEPSIQLDSISWNNGSKSLALWAKGAATFTAEMHLDECVFYDSIGVRTKWCDETSICLPIPNAFTPNGDGANDLFSPLNLCEIFPVQIEFTIFNRWGEIVFQSEGQEWPHWDGNNSLSDVYVWRLLIMFEADGTILTILKSGDVTLLR